MIWNIAILASRMMTLSSKLMMSNFKPGKRKNVGHTYAVPAVMIPG
jgi:hypothetical protein